MITPEKKKEWMRSLETYAKFSNCRSRHIACIILDDDGELIAIEHNRTANPVCINKECYKRMMGDDSGPSPHCKAVHAEEGAAKIVKHLMMRDSPFIKVTKKPYTAIMNCGYPCANCLQELFSSHVKNLVLKNKTFYTDFDKKIWEETYSKRMTAEVCNV